MRKRLRLAQDEDEFRFFPSGYLDTPLKRICARSLIHSFDKTPRDMSALPAVLAVPIFHHVLYPAMRHSPPLPPSSMMSSQHSPPASRIIFSAHFPSLIRLFYGCVIDRLLVTDAPGHVVETSRLHDLGRLHGHLRVLEIRNVTLVWGMRAGDVSRTLRHLQMLVFDGVALQTPSMAMAPFATLLKTVRVLALTNMRPSSQTPMNELFAHTARALLAHNPNLCTVDLRDSGVDLMARVVSNGQLISLSAQLSRWGRQLETLAFDSRDAPTRTLCMLRRQTPQLRGLCLRSACSDEEDGELMTVGSFPSLRRLCLRGHQRVTDSVLQVILAGTPSLVYLNVAECPVHVASYWHLLPTTLRVFVLDEPEDEVDDGFEWLLRQCPHLRIYMAASECTEREMAVRRWHCSKSSSPDACNSVRVAGRMTKFTGRVSCLDILGEQR